MLATLDYAKPLQVADEFGELLALLRRERVTSYLEIGSRYGGSFERIMYALGLGARGMAVEFPGGAFGDNESAPKLMAAIERVRVQARSADYVLGPSSAPEVIGRAAAVAPYDAVMIDADHRYEAVKRDFENYAPMARRLIILHDIAAPDGWVSTRGLPVEVPRFWREIRDRYEHKEIVAPGSEMGIGVLFVQPKR